MVIWNGQKLIELGVDINVATGTTRFDYENEPMNGKIFSRENETAFI